MDAIFSSKLYKTSRRKDKIASALKNPINMELVQQLDTYLNDVDTVQEAPEVIKVPMDSEPVVDKPEEREVIEVNKASKSAPKPTPVIVDDEASQTSEDSEPKTEEVTHLADEDTTEPEVKVDEPKERDEQSTFHSLKQQDIEDKTVEESTSINSATTLYQPPVEASCCDKMRVNAAAIKGTLNIRDDTKGVSRIFAKDKELWIYYQDKINLNSVMEPVIDVLNSTGFTNLEFNRLARTENAIVFEISCIYDDVKPMVEEEK